MGELARCAVRKGFPEGTSRMRPRGKAFPGVPAREKFSWGTTQPPPGGMSKVSPRGKGSHGN